MNIENLEKRLSHKYKFIELIGRGGFAEVYLAKDLLLEREVAIKVILSQYANEPETRERFIREAKLYAKLEHKNLIPIYDTGVIDHQAFIIMKYISGESAKSIQQKLGKLSIELVSLIIREMADTLQYIHEKGIVHRDIKPANILIENNTRHIYLADFGIARSDSSKTLTQSGFILGTPQYISPEQIKGKAIDQRSDLYTLGVMLYELISGKPVFSGETPMEILYQHVNENPEPISTLAPHIPREIKYIISRCIEKNPEDRFQDAREILEILENRKATFITRYLKSLEKRKNKPGIKKVFLLFLLFLAIGTAVFLIKFFFPDSIEKKVNNRRQVLNKQNTGTRSESKKLSVSSIPTSPGITTEDPTGKARIQTGELKKNRIEPDKTKKKSEENQTDQVAPISSDLLTSTVKFSSFPAADVYWNDIKLGNTSQVFVKRLNPGKYIFKFVIPDYQTIEKEILVEENTDMTVHQKFPPYGILTVTAKPYARFYINGKDYGTDFMFKKKFPAGEYTIRAMKQGYQTEERAVEIDANKPVNIHFILKKEEKDDQ